MTDESQPDGTNLEFRIRGGGDGDSENGESGDSESGGRELPGYESGYDSDSPEAIQMLVTECNANYAAARRLSRDYVRDDVPEVHEVLTAGGGRRSAARVPVPGVPETSTVGEFARGFTRDYVRDAGPHNDRGGIIRGELVDPRVD